MRTYIEPVDNRNLRRPMKERLSLRALAYQIDLPHRTLHDKIRRGTVPKPNLFKDRDVRDYSAEIAQAAIDAGNLDKGLPMRMKTTMAKLLRIEIVDRHHSRYNALALLRKQGIPDLPSERYVYDHIYHGDFGISPSQLPCKPTSTAKSAPSPAAVSKYPAFPSKTAPTATIALGSDTGEWTASSPVSTARDACSCSSSARPAVASSVWKLPELSSRTVYGCCGSSCSRG